MARTKQTARLSTGGLAPRKMLATKGARKPFEFVPPPSVNPPTFENSVFNFGEAVPAPDPNVTPTTNVEVIAHQATEDFAQPPPFGSSTLTVGNPVSSLTPNANNEITPVPNTFMQETKPRPFMVEYAASGRSACKKCYKKIPAGELRFGHRRQATHFDGKITRWFHVKCYLERNRNKKFKTNQLNGFEDLRKADALMIMELCGQPIGSGYLQESFPEDVSNTENFTPEQSKALRWALQEALLPCPTALIKQLLQGNNQYATGSHNELVVRCAECILWHNLPPCPLCQTGQLVRRNDVYKCEGFVSSWSKCTFCSSQGVERTSPFVFCKTKRRYDTIMNQISNAYSRKQLGKWINSFLKEHKNKVASQQEQKERFPLPLQQQPFPLPLQQQPFPLSQQFGQQTPMFSQQLPLLQQPPNLTSNVIAINNSVPATSDKMSLRDLVIAIRGNNRRTKSALRVLIAENGGTYSPVINSSVTHVITTKDFFEDPLNSEMKQEIENFQVMPVREEFLDACIETGEEVDDLDYLVELGFTLDEKGFHFIIDADPTQKLKQNVTLGINQVEFTSKSKKAVDPASNLQNRAHVLRSEDDGSLYDTILNQTDITQNMNSYYIAQVLETDDGSEYYLFCKWGRVGTSIGSSSLKHFKSKTLAIEAFHKCFKEKTQNEWSNRANFTKQPKGYFPVEKGGNDDDDDEKRKPKIPPGVKSHLDVRVQELVELLFDANTFKNTLVELNVDVKKMPLGKLSKDRLMQGLQLLREIETNLLKNNKNPSFFVDFSNRFYTLIPHEFGLKSPPIINNIQILKERMEAMEGLLDLERSWNIINAGETTDETQHPTDVNYGKLKTQLSPLDSDSSEYQMIQDMVTTTVGSQFNLQISNIFYTERSAEKEGGSNFNSPKRYLLWHGSRLSNYVGILSQGLRIAPPEAPASGYMFGKGIYFADMISKSFAYCHASSSNSKGLLLIAEVTLGESLLLTQPRFVEKKDLVPPILSVKACGKIEPTFVNAVETPFNNVKRPTAPIQRCGPDFSNSVVEENEYVVYDPCQVRMRYLVFLHNSEH